MCLREPKKRMICIIRAYIHYFEQNIQKIVSFLSKICHSQMNFEVTLEEETSQTKQADFPPQVKIVCSAFKGSILGADGGN